MSITYKTVITNAISGFNSIQNELSKLSDLGISSTTLSNGVISGSITPEAMVTAIGKVATIKNGSTFVSGKITYRGSASATVNPEVSQSGATITAKYSKSLAGAGYYTGGTISGTTTYTIPSGSVTLSSNISTSTSNTGISVVKSAGYISSGTSYISGVTVPKDKPFAITMTADTAADTTSNLTVTNAAYRTISLNGGGDKGVLINGANGKTATVDGTVVTDANGDLITATVTPSSTVAALDSEGSNSTTVSSRYFSVDPSASINKSGWVTSSNIGSGITKNYTVQAGSVALSNILTSTTNNGISISKSSGWIDSGTSYISKITVPSGKSLGQYTSSTNYSDGVTINGASGSIGKLYAGFATSGYGDLYLRNAGATAYTKVATSGKLITVSPTFDGGGLSGGGLTATSSNASISDTNNGISVAVSRATVSRAAVLYNGAVNGWVSAADNKQALAAGSLGSGTLTKYITAINVPKDIAFSVTMTADTALDTASNLSITNAAYRNISITNSENGTLTINGGAVDKGVLISGANGKTVKVDNTTVTDVNGDLITTARSAGSGSLTLTAGAGSVSANSNVTLSTSNNGISVSGCGTVNGSGSGSVSTGTGWISSGSTSSNAATGSKQSNTATKYITAINVPKDVAFSVTMAADTAEDSTSTLSISTNAYRKTSINGGGDKGVLISGANGKTATVDGTVVTNTSGDLITTKMSSSVSGSKVTVSTGTGWISAGSISGTVASGTLSTSDATENNAVPSGYTENSSIVVPTKGWLLIGDGYYPKTAISLDTILGGKDDGETLPITSGYIRSGYKAYNIDGELITGAMANWSPSSTYYTSTNTGLGAVTGGQYITSTKYIIKGAGSVSGTATGSATVTVSPGTVSISKVDINSSTDSDGYDGSTSGLGDIYASTGTVTTTLPTSGYYLAVKGTAAANTTGTTGSITGSGTATATISTAGWISSISNGSVSVSGTATAKTSEKSSSVTYIPIAAGGCSIDGGKLTVNTNYTGTPTITLATGSSTNMSNIKIGAQDTTNYPYYFKVAASTAELTGQTKVTRANVTSSRSAGYISKADTATVISSESAYPTVTVSAASGNTYINLKAGKCTVAGGALSGGALTATANYSGTPNLNLSIASTSSTNLSSITLTTEKPTSQYITLSSSTDKMTGTTTATRAAVTRAAVTSAYTAGYIPAKDASTVINADSTTIPQKTVSPTVTVNAASKTSYLVIPSANPTFDGGGLSGGELTKGTASGGTLSVSASSSVGLTTSNTSGIYFTISRSAFSQKVTRAAVTRDAVLYNGAVNGWVTKNDNTVALDSGTLSSGESTVSLATGTIKRYINTISVPSSKTLTKVTNNGIIAELNGTGIIATNSGSTTISSNTGTLKIVANSGTVKYTNNWTITKDSSGNLTFTYSA